MPFAPLTSELPSGCRTPTEPLLEYYGEASEGTITPRDVIYAPLEEKSKGLGRPLYVQPSFQLQEPELVVPGPLPLGRIEKVDTPEGVAPPPLPHAVARPITWQEKTPSQHVISAGSVGHPFNCAEACKYVKRKGGCRDAANCTKCHECFWSRVPAGETSMEKINVQPAQQAEAQAFSVGSAGHPYTCAQACKYVWRKQGCRDGANCPNCHFCKWQRHPKEEDSTPEPPSIRPPPGLTPIEEPLLSSVGSLGHPYGCGLACKYVGKAQGCKDGTQCPNCHLCRWSRYTNMKVFHL